MIFFFFFFFFFSATAASGAASGAGASNRRPPGRAPPESPDAGTGDSTVGAVAVAGLAAGFSASGSELEITASGEFGGGAIASGSGPVALSSAIGSNGSAPE